MPACIVKDAHILSEKPAILNYFNEHFVSSGYLFGSLHPHQPDVQGVCPHSPVNAMAPGFDLTPFEVAEVHRALQQLDLNKSAGPDNLEPFFLRSAADFIAEPLCHIFNLTISENEIPSIWKSAYVLPLLKGGDPSVVNNYRPISKLCALSKVLEKLVSEPLEGLLDANGLLSHCYALLPQ